MLIASAGIDVRNDVSVRLVKMMVDRLTRSYRWRPFGPGAAHAVPARGSQITSQLHADQAVNYVSSAFTRPAPHAAVLTRCGRGPSAQGGQELWTSLVPMNCDV